MLMTLTVHADPNAQGYFGIVKKVRPPQAIPFKKIDEEDKTDAGFDKKKKIGDKGYANNKDKKVHSITFHAKNAIVSVEENMIKPVNALDDYFRERRFCFPFDYHEIRNCDLNRQSIVINLILHDNYSLKSQQMSVLIEHRPQIIKSIEKLNQMQQISILKKSISDKQQYPDVWSNVVDSLQSGLDYASQIEPSVHISIFNKIRVSHVES